MKFGLVGVDPLEVQLLDLLRAIIVHRTLFKGHTVKFRLFISLLALHLLDAGVYVQILLVNRLEGEFEVHDLFGIAFIIENSFCMLWNFF